MKVMKLGILASLVVAGATLAFGDRTLTIQDNVTTNGRFYVTCSDAQDLIKDGTKVSYKWWKSTNLCQWAEVKRRRVESSHYNVAYDGAWVDIVLDGGVLSDNPTNTITNVCYRAQLVLDHIDQDCWSEIEEQRPIEDPPIPDIPDDEPPKPIHRKYKAYYDSLQNGSFETPHIRAEREHWTAGPDRNDLVNGHTTYEGFLINRDDLDHDTITNYLHQANKNWKYGEIFYYRRPSVMWKTTAEDGALELASGNGDYGAKRGTTHYEQAYASYNFGTPYNGDQFAELNCNYPSQLYQDIITVPGSTITWSVAHRARGEGGSDVMYVMIGNTHKIIEDNITTTNAIKEVANNPGRFPGFKVTKCTSGNDRWYVYSDDYVVPAGQYYTRMGFVSIDTTVGRAGGNILDGVSFELKTPAPVGDLDDAVEKLWITDHEQADATHVHLEFEPTFKNPDLYVEDWMNGFVLEEGIVDVIRVAYGRTEAELQENIEKDNTVAAYLNWSYKKKTEIHSSMVASGSPSRCCRKRQESSIRCFSGRSSSIIRAISPNSCEQP